MTLMSVDGYSSVSDMEWSEADDDSDYDTSVSELDWAGEICRTSVPPEDHPAVHHPRAGSPALEINSEENNESVLSEIGPTRFALHPSRYARKAAAPYQVPSTSKKALLLVPHPKRQITPNETEVRPPAPTPGTQCQHTVSLDQTQKPKGKARASPGSPQKPPRKLTAADINLTFAVDQKIKCPWPECHEYVPFVQGLFSDHILENEKTHHLTKVEHVPCPLGCPDIPYNVSRHIIRNHYDRVIKCPVHTCKGVFKGDSSHIIRHLSSTKHPDYEKPADGQLVQLVAFVRPKKERRKSGRAFTEE